MENETKNQTEPSEADGISENEQTPQSEQPVKPSKWKQFLQFLIFTGFMASAGIIQFVSTGVLSTWTGWIPYWTAYMIGLVLSVVWSFTFNRKFTFKAANNVPLAMCLVVIYYCAFTPLSTFGADAIVDAWATAAGDSWNADYEMVITAGMMIVNFLTEFLWDKFVVFNQKVTDRILGMFKKKSAQKQEAETVDENPALQETEASIENSVELQETPEENTPPPTPNKPEQE